MKRLMILATMIPLLAFGEGDAKAPDFMRVDAAGHKVRLSNYRGKVVLLDFWATWCAGCKQEMPWYVQFAGKYKKDGWPFSASPWTMKAGKS